MNRRDYSSFGARINAKRGSELAHAKLTESSVRVIRANVHGRTARQLAEEFGVHFRTIEKVRSYETWCPR